MYCVICEKSFVREPLIISRWGISNELCSFTCAKSAIKIMELQAGEVFNRGMETCFEAREYIYDTSDKTILRG